MLIVELTRNVKTSKSQNVETKAKTKGSTSYFDFLIFRRFDFWSFDIPPAPPVARMLNG